MKFGCVLSSFDARDYTLNQKVCAAQSLPESYECTLTPLVRNQRSVSSCTAHAMCSILEQHADPREILSTNFIYGIRKELFNSQGEGMSLRDACKIAQNYGDMTDDDCPGNDEVPNCYEKAEKAFNDATKLETAGKYRISKYFKCNSKEDIKYALYNYGPVLASMKWYSTYHANMDGVLDADKSGSSGYHAIMIYGYTPDGFWCQNSYGRSWGKGGRFFVPNSLGFREAIGIVDWNGTDKLKEPNTDGIKNTLYKLFNSIINFIRSLVTK